MKKFLFIFLLISLFGACKKEDNSETDTQHEIKDFVWKGLNAYYLWKDEIPDLSDTRFKNQAELDDYLDEFPDPAILFESLLYQRGVIDRWSWIVDDYVALEKMFQGIRKTTGMRIGLVYEPGSNSRIFAYVRYVLPGSPAEKAGIKRGDLFRKVNGTYLTDQNYSELLGEDVLTIELAQWQNDLLADTGIIIELVKEEISENPIYLHKIISQNGKNIGYLMYNNFISEYDHELNDVMGFFKDNQIDELILDLRYNSGGSVATMQYLASMITGQYTGEKLVIYQWHSQLQNWYQQNYPESLYRPFVDTMSDGTFINSLNLNKIYIIATRSSASASESLINCLRPYIDIIQIGTETHGKYTASITLYDSPDFTKDNINPDHKWAMQPIVLKIANVMGVSDFYNGLTPDIFISEDYKNLGILGDPNERLLKTALNAMEGNPFAAKKPNLLWQEVYFRQFKTDGIQKIDEFIPPLLK